MGFIEQKLGSVEKERVIKKWYFHEKLVKNSKTNLVRIRNIFPVSFLESVLTHSKSKSYCSNCSFSSYFATYIFYKNRYCEVKISFQNTNFGKQYSFFLKWPKSHSCHIKVPRARHSGASPRGDVSFGSASVSRRNF